jgi:hypothetical protein
MANHFPDRQRRDDADQHEGGGDPEHHRPGLVVGQDQRQRPRHQTRDAVGIHEDGRAGSQFIVGQQLAPVGIDDDVLARAEQGDNEYDHDDHLQRGGRIEIAEHADRQQQHDLREERPAPPAAEERQLEPVHQRRPHEFPGVGQADQCEQADGGKVDVVAAQPGRHQGNQHIEGHSRAETQEDAGQHLPGEQDLGPTALRFRPLAGCLGPRHCVGYIAGCRLRVMLRCRRPEQARPEALCFGAGG